MASEPLRITEPVKFGEDFELDVRAYELRRAGRSLKLERIPMELLVLLVELRGQLVTRDQIVERVWGKGVFLDTDNSINAAIRKIRQVLKDDPERPRFVVTVTGKGYRFVGVEEASVPPPAPPAVSEAPASATENLLGKKISHYRILQFLGGGGMGVVYKAEDLKLGRQVALKFLPGELASDQHAFERFEREARAASALDHPNICAIHQLGEYEGQPFIVMQLLEGQTLREWIERASGFEASLRFNELLGIAIQIAEGLDAAHQKGIIHRDIKPANIFITNRGQAKILDFGVAKFLDAREFPDPKPGTPASLIATPAADPLITRTASIGTPSYLSPEQIRRETLDARTDLFSFGLVLYEMVTGRKGFEGNSVTAISDAVLHLRPVPVQEVDPNIPEKMSAVIAKSLEKDRDQRYQSAAEIRSDLQQLQSSSTSQPLVTGASVASSTGVSRPAHGKFWKVVLPVLAGLAAIVIGYAALTVRGARNRVNPTQLQSRRSVAVLGFDNLGGHSDTDWLSTGLSQMLTTELAAGGKLRLIPGEDVARAKTELHISEPGTLSKYNLGRLRKNLGADLVVFGSYAVLKGGETRLDVRLQDAANGEVVAALAETGSDKKLFDLVSLTGSDMRQRLGVGTVPTSYEAGIKAALPSNPEAARLYSEGLEKLRVLDSLEARDLLLRAAELDPTHAATHSALVEAWRNLGYDAKAQEEAQKAVDLSADLGREDRLWIEGQAHEIRHEWDKAADAYRSLIQTFPDGLEYGMRLASVQMSAGKSREALATAELLRNLPPPSRDDPRIDLMAANAYAQLGDFQQEQTVATRAVQAARARESTLVAARAMVSQCEALRNLAQFAQAISACKEAQNIFADGGDRSHVATSINALALTLRDQGDLSSAKAKYEEALSIARKTGEKRAEARYTNNLADILNSESDYGAAKQMFEQSLQLAREIGDKRGATNTLGNLGLTMESMGDLSGARTKFEQALALARETGNKQIEASNQIHLAELSFLEGDLPGTSHALESADALLAGSGDKRHHLYALYTWGDVLSAKGDLAGARSKIQEALDTSKQIGAKDLIAYSQMSLANIMVEEGRPSEALALAQGAVAEYEVEKSPSFEIQALESSANALLKDGKAAEADQAMQRANQLLSAIKDPLTKIDVSTLSARASATLGKPALALAPLHWAISESHRRSAVGREFEARLALGEIEMQSGSQKSGRTRLQQLQKDAQAKGFLLIARKAAALRASLISPIPRG